MKENYLPKFIQKYTIFLVLIALIIFFSLATRNFFSFENFMTIARQASMLGISAVGMTTIVLMGEMDLSVGSASALVGIICSTLMVNQGVHPVAAICISILVGAGLGFINGAITWFSKIPALITTLGTMGIYRGFCYVITSGLPVFGFHDGFSFIGGGYVSVVPFPVIIMAAIMLLGFLLLNNTAIGRHIYAIGGNREAARLSGINTGRVYILMFILSAIFSAIAGVILTSRLMSGQPSGNEGFEFDVITAVILGGISFRGGEGKISNVFWGVLIVGVLSNGLVMLNVNVYWQRILKGMIMVGAVAADSLNRSRKIKASSRTTA